MPKILLIGATGQIGFELLASLAPLGQIIAPSRQELDLVRLDSIHRFVETLAPDVIVNAAAYTSVDKAETDSSIATAVNATGVAELAQIASKTGALLVHYSTDYVFDGQQASWYRETDEANPISVYGRTKYQGEQFIRQYVSRHLIFRTSWVFGLHGANFAKTILRLARETDQLKVVADQWGAPCAARLVADVTAQVLNRYWNQANGGDFPFGVYHVTSSGETCWHRYAQEIIAFAQAQGAALKMNPENVLPIPSSEYPLPALRPANSRLCTDKIRQTFGLHLPDWKQCLHPVLETLIDLSNPQRIGITP
jgi:dTDP-4-dehydrorhamnose reductase